MNRAGRILGIGLLLFLGVFLFGVVGLALNAFGVFG